MGTVRGNANPPYGDCDPYDDCSAPMRHQDLVMLIYVFSIFGLILVLLVSSFYACHLYARRLDRLHPPTAAAPRDAERRLVPMKQACFIEQPDGKSDIAWVISTSADDQPQTSTAPGDAKKGAAFERVRNDSSAALLSAASLQSADSLQSAGSLPSTSALIESPTRAHLLPGSARSLSPLQRAS